VRDFPDQSGETLISPSRAKQHKKSPAKAGLFYFLVPVQSQDRFWRRERSESKAFFPAKA